jgi:hypothetical protein
MLPAKADPDAQARYLVDELEPRLAQARAGQHAVFFVDAAHFVLAPFLGFLWSLTRIFLRAPAGPLGSPSEVPDSIVVGAFHTHPNVGPCWGAVFASGTDTTTASNVGVPLLIIGAFPTVAATQTTFTGPARRLHLAGDRGFPGTSGGEAPQATIDGSYDEL